MENLLSNQWDSILLHDLKEEALLNGRSTDENLKSRAIYLYDNPKMSVFKSDYIVLESTFPQIVLISKHLFSTYLESGEFQTRDDLVEKATSFVKSVGSHKDIIKTPLEDFISWAEKSGLHNVVQNLNLQKKSSLKI